MTAQRITLAPPPLNLREIIRYAGGCDPSMAEECAAQAASVLTFNVCFATVGVRPVEGGVDLGFARVESRDLAKNLSGCLSAIVFAATVGVGMDRLIGKYTRLMPSRAAVLQAVGSERVESLCDAFEEEILARLGNKATLRPRFSPGYGDLPLEFQKEVFALLDCYKNLGISLSDSLLMTPEKSVTAIIGIKE